MSDIKITKRYVSKKKKNTFTGSSWVDRKISELEEQQKNSKFKEKLKNMTDEEREKLKKDLFG
jgi:hypothetical protein